MELGKNCPIIFVNKVKTFFALAYFGESKRHYFPDKEDSYYTESKMKKVSYLLIFGRSFLLDGIPCIIFPYIMYNCL